MGQIISMQELEGAPRWVKSEFFQTHMHVEQTGPHSLGRRRTYSGGEALASRPIGTKSSRHSRLQC
jgi:hypothetical protein